ncbi:hypothetical protein QOZ80_9AG0670310 [Eleusine coracana subsp. coracana]|nr:hypothetical protein QOZ80_9AG0670310 [Eleusine coracana subsp. coracana]
MGDADDTEEDESFRLCMDGEEEHTEAVFFPVGGGEDEEEDEAGDDVRHSFATAVGDIGDEEEEEDEEEEDTSRYDYGMWTMEETDEEAMSIQERRRRLLHGMGLNSSRDLLRSRNARSTAVSVRGTTTTMHLPPVIPRSSAAPRNKQPPKPPPPPVVAASPEIVVTHPKGAAAAALMTRCRSDSRLAARGVGRKPLMTLRRVKSLPHSLLHHGASPPVHHNALRAAVTSSAAASKHDGNGSGGLMTTVRGGQLKEEGEDLHRSVEMSVERLVGNAPAPVVVNQNHQLPMRRSHSQPVPAASASSSANAKVQDGGKPVLKKRARWLKNIKLVAGLMIDKEQDDRPNKNNNKSSPAAAGASMMMSKSASAHHYCEQQRLKVHHYGKPSKELTGLYMRQQLRAHEGSIWTMKFSPDARLLATAGEDRVVRLWKVIDDDSSLQELSSSSSSSLPPPQVPQGLAAQLSRKVRRGRSSKHVLPDRVFAIDERPACVLEGHQDDVLDLSWSANSKHHLLSSSMDKTVRLWDMDTHTCLKLFAHNDYVTCVQFNPVDDDYFISGSLDSKVRIWSVPDRQVVDWSDLNDMVTAACYTPDGQAAIIGSHKGSCRFYKTTDCKLNQEAQIDMSISKKRKSQAKKITGFQFAPGNPSEILVTSADSQIRVFNGITVLQKFKGFKNTSSQISASYTADGRYVVCASEDSHVYLWRRAAVSSPSVSGGIAAAGSIGVRAKTWLTSRSYEYFFCRDVSVALPWPGGSPFQQRPSRSATSVHGGGDASRRSDGGGDVDAARRPTKSGPMTYSSSSSSSSGGLPRRDSSARWHGGTEGGNAWGMVVVTASRGGEIRVYQNFGLPLGVKGQQSNPFSSTS